MNRQTPHRTAILHIGGPKTGSATIQKVLSAQPLPEHHYIKTGNANHSPLLALLFGRGNNQSAPYFRRRGWGPERLAAQRRDWQAELSAEMEGTGKHLILSAEIFCAPVFDDASLRALKAFLAPHVRDIRVIGYVRSPVSYCQSSFQQRLKGVNPVSLELAPVHYKKRFQKFDTVFGRENVTLRHYDRNTLADGDVVVDFAQRLGVDLVDYTRTETNTSLSLEAVALLYARQKFGRRIKPYPRYDADTDAFLRILRKLEPGRLSFGPAILEPMLEKCAPDIDWMEQRLGVTIRDYPDTGGRVISSEQDLLAVAAKAQERLQVVLIEEILQGAKGARATAVLADLLRRTVSEN